jgi:transglutaminase-like putative cysteine protease
MGDGVRLAQLPQAANAQPVVFPLSDGDSGTAETIEFIRQLVDQGVKDPVVNRTAIAIVQAARVASFDFAGEIRAIYNWIRQNIRFVRDIAGKETLRTAREILQVRAGDCDDINAILLPSLIGSIGGQVRLVTISSHPAAPDQFSHIYAEALVDGRWIALDAARRNPRLGRAPEHYFRKRIWQLSSSEYTDVQGMRAVGLGYYTPMGQFDWGTVASTISSIGQAAGSIITAVRGPSSYISPYISPAGTSALAPVAQVQYGTTTNWSALLPWILGGGLILIFAMRK